MTSGEGGILTTNSAEFYGLAESFHSFGRRPGPARYDHYTLAWTPRPSGVQAAVLRGPLTRPQPATAPPLPAGHPPAAAPPATPTYARPASLMRVGTVTASRRGRSAPKASAASRAAAIMAAPPEACSVR